jgi:hypothetical protein
MVDIYHLLQLLVQRLVLMDILLKLQIINVLLVQPLVQLVLELLEHVLHVFLQIKKKKKKKKKNYFLTLNFIYIYLNKIRKYSIKLN